MTGSLTTGYVFRVENEATVNFLKDVGEPGHLTNVLVSPEVPASYGLFVTLFRSEPLASTLFLIGIALTIVVVVLLGIIHDWWALGVLGMLMLARLINIIVIKRRSMKNGWKGAPEPGKDGDLLILLSQDRWVRMRGKVDDIKKVTAGQWLREETIPESFVVSFATLLVYGSAALAGNASTIGSLLMACLLLVSVGVLGLCNAATKTLHLFDRVIARADSHRKKYERRLDMVYELMEETCTQKWALKMDLVTEERLQENPPQWRKRKSAMLFVCR